MLHQFLLSLICLITPSLYPSASASAAASATARASSAAADQKSAAADVKASAASHEADSKVSTALVPTYPEWEDEQDKKAVQGPVDMDENWTYRGMRGCIPTGSPQEQFGYLVSEAVHLDRNGMSEWEHADLIAYLRAKAGFGGRIVYDRQIENRRMLYRHAYRLASFYCAFIASQMESGNSGEKLESFARSLGDQLSVLSEKMQQSVCAAAVAVQMLDECDAPTGPAVPFLLSRLNKKRPRPDIAAILSEILWKSHLPGVIKLISDDYVGADAVVSLRAVKPFIEVDRRLYLKNINSLAGLSEISLAEYRLKDLSAEYNTPPAGLPLMIPPDCFSGLEFVTNVTLSNQNISEFPMQIFVHCPRLDQIDLCDNKIISLPADFEERVPRPEGRLLIGLRRNPLTNETKARIKILNLSLGADAAALRRRSGKHIYFDEDQQPPASAAPQKPAGN